MDPIEFRPKYSYAFWIWIIFICTYIFIYTREANERYLEDSSTLAAGLANIFIFYSLLFGSFVGKLRSITITDTIVIDRYLMNPVVRPMGIAVRIEDQEVDLAGFDIKTRQFRNSKKIKRILERLAHDGMLKTKEPAADGEDQRIEMNNFPFHSIPLILYLIYILTDLVFGDTIFPGNWDRLILRILLFFSWYVLFRVYERRKNMLPENPEAS